MILPLFPTLASSKGDTVILNTITKAEPGQRCNHTGPERRNEDVNSWLLHLHFHPSPPFSILSVFRQREGCVRKTGPGDRSNLSPAGSCRAFTVQRRGKCRILRSGLLTFSARVCKCVQRSARLVVEATSTHVASNTITLAEHLDCVFMV